MLSLCDEELEMTCAVETNGEVRSVYILYRCEIRLSLNQYECLHLSHGDRCMCARAWRDGTQRSQRPTLSHSSLPGAATRCRCATEPPRATRAEHRRAIGLAACEHLPWRATTC